MKRFNWLFLILIAVLFFAFLIPISADVAFSKDSQGDAQSVFVAGNPDLYPIEYFNPKTQQYEGVMPLIFERISEESGIDFTYIYASKENKQQYLAKNAQVDIVSAYVDDLISNEHISKDSVLLNYSYEGKQQTVAIGFTSVCDDNVKQIILDHLQAMSEDELTSLIVTYIMTHDKESTAFNWIWISVIAVALICIVALLLLIRRNRKKVVSQKNYDPTTGLYSRSYLDVILGTLIQDFVRKRYYAICVSANHENLLKYYGSEQAQSLSDYVMNTLQAQTQQGEYVVHADTAMTFLWLIQAPTREYAEKRISEIIEKINQENGILSEDYRVTISAGCYGLSQTSESGERVLKIASEAYIYAEENSLRCFFVDPMFIKMIDRKALLQKETVQAVKKEQILFYLQYIVDIQSNRIVGAEALSRWEHPREGLLLPASYIKLMQQAKNIHLLDFYMFEKCCQQLQLWSTDETKELLISCNFDRQTAARDDFYDRIMEISKRYEIDRARVVLEITEETFVYNRENVIRNTKLLQEASFRVALDDFGSGSTSFQNLIEYHVSYLKLDRVFVEIMKTAQGEMLVSGIVKASHALGLPILQEGVETLDQLEKCKALEIDLVQGFIFSRVIPRVEGERVRRRLLARLASGELSDRAHEPKKIKSLALNASDFSIVESITEESSKKEKNMENNNLLTQNFAELISTGTRYRWSFTGRLHQAPEAISSYYSDIKNAFLKYKKVRSRISWSCDTISFGKEQLAKLVLTTKTLYVYLALSPEELEGTKYFFTDESSTKKYEKVPVRIRVRSNRAMKHAFELIEKIAEAKELQLAKEFEAVDYALPYENVQTLLERQLIKKIEAKGTALSAEIDGDEEVAVDLEDSAIEEKIAEESISEEIAEEPVAEDTIEAPVAEEKIVKEPATDLGITNMAAEIKQTPVEEIQNADLMEAESIHVAFLQNICKQFDADELNAHVKIVHKKRREKKVSVFDIEMKKNRS